MIILAIETSCDDTCIALILALGKKRLRFKILSNIVSSQVKIHRKWGGVYPSLAKREHQHNLVPVLKQVLMESRLLKSNIKNQKVKNKLRIKNLEKILEREEYLFEKLKKFLRDYKKPKIDLITITIGPGLEPCLWVGVNFAKALAYFWGLKILPINHIEAHILANWLPPVSSNLRWQISNLKNIFPAVCLVVSGGHTQLILMKGFGKYKILGETRDDAAGECFDKVARILGLGYPGGPAIAQIAKQWKSPTPMTNNRIKLPRPMINSKDYDFSFSGLKTAVLYNFKSQSEKTQRSKKYIRKMCAETQQAIIDVLIRKTLRAAKEYKVKTIMLGGGVTANEELRKQFQKIIKKNLPNTKCLIPDTKYCTDNAVMTGITAYCHLLKGKKRTWREIKVKANLRIN